LLALINSFDDYPRGGIKPLALDQAKAAWYDQRGVGAVFGDAAFNGEHTVALAMALRRWAMTRRVHLRRPSASDTCFWVMLSNAEVASSRRSTRGLAEYRGLLSCSRRR
jgi:hypothetical protein